jgi:hypothetical protein
MSEVEVFLQGAGIERTRLIRLPENSTVNDLVEAARKQGLQLTENELPVVLLEDGEEPLALDAPLASAGITHRGRVHIHHCRHVEVTVNFNGHSQARSFPSAQTLHRVKAWAAKEFKLPEADAAEHALQLCHASERPPEDTHLGTLVSQPGCAVCFDLVPKQRIEGAS